MDDKKTGQLARFLQYALGRRPDEFGLVTDPRGFVPLADILKVCHEEGWTHIRRNHIDTLNYHLGRPFVECQAHLVRAADRSRLAEMGRTAACPKLLYAPIRRRAYAAASQHGLLPRGHTGQVVLFADRTLAEKAGRRRDAAPILVTVNVRAAQDSGCVFTPFGVGIFLTDRLPPDCCRLPRPPVTLPRREPDAPAAPSAPKTPGSFLLDVEPLAAPPAQPNKQARRQRSKDWKKERRKARRWKQDRGAAE